MIACIKEESGHSFPSTNSLNQGDLSPHSGFGRYPRSSLRPGCRRPFCPTGKLWHRIPRNSSASPLTLANCVRRKSTPVFSVSESSLGANVPDSVFQEFSHFLICLIDDWRPAQRTHDEQSNGKNEENRANRLGEKYFRAVPWRHDEGLPHGSFQHGS